MSTVGVFTCDRRFSYRPAGRRPAARARHAEAQARPMLGQLRHTGAPCALHVYLPVRCSHQCCVWVQGRHPGLAARSGRGWFGRYPGCSWMHPGSDYLAGDRWSRCPPCPTAARGGWAAKRDFGRARRMGCSAAEGADGWNRREIGFGVDWYRSPLLALRGAAVGGDRILLPNPSNHFQLSWTEKCTQERDRRKMVGQVGQVGHDSVSLDTPTPHRHISHDRARRRGVGARERRQSTQQAILRTLGERRGTSGAK